MSARSAYARKKATSNEKSRMRGRQPSITNLHQDYAVSMGQGMPQGVPGSSMSNGVPNGMPQGMPAGMSMGMGPGGQMGQIGPGEQIGVGLGVPGMPGIPQGLPPGFASPPPTPSVGTGVPTMNGRFLKFSATSPTGPSVSDQTTYSGYGGGSISGRGTSTVPTSRGSGSGSPLTPVDEFGMVRTNMMPYQQQPQPQRKPTLKTEDTSGVEKSGLRSLMDKRSDEVRRGLAKKFTFSKKNKEPKADGDNISDKDYPQSQQGLGRASSFVQPSTADPMQLHRSQSQSQFTTASMPISLPHNHHFQHPLPPMPLSYQQQHTSSQHGHHNSMGGQQQQQQQQQQHHYNNNQMQSPDGWDGYPTSPPSGQLPPTPQIPHVRRWIGAGRPVQPWNKLRKDPELWDPNGDVLVYLAHRDQHPRPPASFRLSSHIIEATASRPLITLLREGSTEEDLNCMPPHGVGAGPFGMVARGAPGQPTPPVSEESVYLGDPDGQISYEMFFPVPPGLDRAQQLRHQLTTRNTFALLYHASLVGTSVFQALTDLHARLDMYISLESDILADVINYVCARGIDDIRSDPETAIGLLAWAESPDVRWEDGWIECFVHCVGMFPSLERCGTATATAS